MKFRFGRMPVDSFKKKQNYLSNLPTYFVSVAEDKEYVWGFYFVYYKNYKRIDNIFQSIYFERIRIEGDTDGTPAEIIERVVQSNKDLESDQAAFNIELEKILSDEKGELYERYAAIKYHYDIYSLKRYAAYTNNSFYLVGWMPQNDAKKLQNLTKDDPRITVLLEDPGAVEKALKTPTKMKNWAIFRPFEQFVRMYGTPGYEEIDPTPMLSVFYMVFFGLMFGDVGHGICVFSIGLFLTLRKKGGCLAKILIPIGISSTFFGFMYGAFFGFESDASPIHPLWFTPMENSTNMNRILITTIVIGIFTIITSMVLNMLNGIKQRNIKKLFFSQNGIAGLAFYSAALYGIYEFLLVPDKIKNLGSLITLALVSLGVIFLLNPLSNLLAKLNKKKKVEKEESTFIEALFELAEVLLGFITNTISFARIGAFTLSHAGIMSAVIMFMQKFPNESLIIGIVGNIFVIGFEGLIVGIQTLRLGYYEMFSRFYTGDGVDFVPLCENAA
jgi:V/A-type H+-transporting ATPase subunit I